MPDTPLRILAIDDEPQVLSYYKDALENFVHHTTESTMTDERLRLEQELLVR